MKDKLIINAKDLPLPVEVIGKGHKVSEYVMIPTRNRNGAQLCANKTSDKQ